MPIHPSSDAHPISCQTPHNPWTKSPPQIAPPTPRSSMTRTPPSSAIDPAILPPSNDPCGAYDITTLSPPFPQPSTMAEMDVSQGFHGRPSPYGITISQPSFAPSRQPSSPCRIAAIYDGSRWWEWSHRWLRPMQPKREKWSPETPSRAENGAFSAIVTGFSRKSDAVVSRKRLRASPWLEIDEASAP